MGDLPDEAVPEPGNEAVRPHGTNVPATAACKPGARAGLAVFTKVGEGGSRRAPPLLGGHFGYGPQVALTICLFGFAWAASSYVSSGQWPFYAANTQASALAQQDRAERSELLRMTQKMSGDIRVLQASVEALRAGQTQSTKIAANLDGVSARLDAVKSETGSSAAALAVKVERIQRESEAKFSQLLDRLDRMERQLAASAGAGASGAAAPAAPQRQAQIAVTPAKPAGEDADGQRKPRLITNWVVREVYDGVALVESPRGSIEVAPGEVIPGAGRVKSIERRGAGWIVITSRGLVDSARASYVP
jgi:hypothetical protein